MRAIILAAGKGTRMLPLTKEIPKHIIPIAGKPFLWYVLENLKKAGITEFGIIVSYKQEQIKEFVRNFGFENVTLIEQKEPLGTGHALMQAREFAGNEKVLVVSGDNFYSADDIKQIMQKQTNMVAAYKAENPSAYGVLVADGEKLVQIDEKPENPVSNLVNTGLYLFEPAIFEELNLLSKSERGEYELVEAITNLAKQGKVFVHKLNDYWLDLGKLSDIPIVESKIKTLF